MTKEDMHSDEQLSLSGVQREWGGHKQRGRQVVAYQVLWAVLELYQRSFRQPLVSLRQS